MYTIIRGRNTGKTKQLLDFAAKNNAIVLTEDKKGLQVKAKNYGFRDIEIIDYNDLNNDNFSFTKPILIHSAETALEYFMNLYYGLKVLGFSATLQEKEKKENV